MLRISEQRTKGNSFFFVLSNVCYLYKIKHHIPSNLNFLQMNVVPFHNAKNICSANFCTKVSKVSYLSSFLNRISKHLTILKNVNFVNCKLPAVLGGGMGVIIYKGERGEKIQFNNY